MGASPRAVKWFIPALRAPRAPTFIAGVAAVRVNRYWSHMRPRHLLAFAFALFSPGSFAAEPKGDTFTDPAKAGVDYALQGEYADDKSGAQVIALGEGKFHIVGWMGGLPGTSDEIEKKAEGDGRREARKVTFENDSWKGSLDGDQLVVGAVLVHRHP